MISILAKLLICFPMYIFMVNNWSMSDFPSQDSYLFMNARTMQSIGYYTGVCFLIHCSPLISVSF